MPSPKRIQQILILSALAAALYFSCLSASSLLGYFSLSGSAKGKIEQWEIEERKERFYLKAVYSFESQEKIWRDSFTFKNDYLNEFAALAALKEKAKQPQTVWHSAKNPSISALERNFPINLIIRTLACYVVSIYFFYLSKRIRSLIY